MGRIADFTMEHPDELLAATGVFSGTFVGMAFEGLSGAVMGFLTAIVVLAAVWASAPRETWEGPHQ